MSKKIVLTNWQVPRDPRMARFDAMKGAAPFDPNAAKIGGIEKHDSTESVIEKMIRKREAAAGKLAEGEAAPKLNLGGIVDDRKDKVILQRKK